MRTIREIHRAGEHHWVGDGFPVRSIFSYNRLGRELSPFLLLDHAGPAKFAPTDRQRGVGEHPHRGFETVTIVYEGEVEHRDSAGNGGRIGAGDVQWMTAASGILHEEYHSSDFARSGGTMEMAPPGYQTLLNKDIPAVTLDNGAGVLRVVAGDYQEYHGPAHTFTPINVWDLRLNAGGRVVLPLPDGHTVALVVLQGTIRINDAESANVDEVVVFEPGNGEVAITAGTDAKLLLLSGEPLNEPIVGHGPFVMNTTDEIRRAFVDFHQGRLGRPAA
ncbi:MAG: pirin family protein [Burkholderiales bacterium]|jgi:redox-sensitive bicupin YhaK (pirin superfamily)|nr:pirin family protein [Burkholderiales bacterium]